MSKLLSLSVVFLFFLPWGYGQHRQAWVDAADTAYAKKEYYKAYRYYEIALEYDRGQPALWFRYAGAARQFNAFTTAEEGYRQVIDRTDTGALRAKSIYWLASVCQRQGRYREALRHYRSFLDRYAAMAPAFAESAKREYRAALWAANQSAQKTNRLHPLGPEINTPYSETGGQWRKDTLFYASHRFKPAGKKGAASRRYAKILHSVNGKAGAPLNIPLELKDQHLANPAFSPDGSRLFFTLCQEGAGGRSRCDIYQTSRLKHNHWQQPKKLKINNAAYTSTHPAPARLTPSGEEGLFFISDRPGGQGGLDIWYSPRDSNGLFGPARNLETINTPGDELTPYFHNRSQRLFFSTDYRIGFGGQDVFQTRRQPNGKFAAPQILDARVNSSYNDVYYALNPEGSVAAFSSDRTGATYLSEAEEACCYDIFKLDIDIQIDLLASTFNGLNKAALAEATVYLYEIAPDATEVVVDSITNPQGNEFRFPLERHKKYRIDARRNGYTTASTSLDLTQQTFSSSTTIEKELFLEPSKIELQAFTFDRSDSSDLDGTTVRLMKLVDGEPQLVAKRTNTDGNDYTFPLELDEEYIIVTEKPGYKPVVDTISFSATDIEKLGPRPRVDLYQMRTTFDDFLPLALYFDNDQPDPNNYSPTTDKTYGESYRAYYNRKPVFIERTTRGLASPDSSRVAFLQQQFFNKKVKAGYQDLMAFSEKVVRFLKGGGTLIIKLRGFASPRTGSRYNYILSQRRIHSVHNQFEKFADGALLPYLQNGQFVIEEEAYGESQANGVMDDIQDQNSSIYGLAASAERRVEIIEIQTGSDTEETPLTSSDE